MKTKEELDQLKQEYQSLTSKLRELDKDELELVVGGEDHCGIYAGGSQMVHAPTLGCAISAGLIGKIEKIEIK